MKREYAKTWALVVSTRFGDKEVAGMCIAVIDDKAKTAEIDTLLAKYEKTQKNQQVSKFYENVHFAAGLK